MRKVLLAAAIVATGVAVAMPLAATADHRPGHEKPGSNSELKIEASPDPVLWGNTLTITGRLRGAENDAKTIELQQRPFPFTAVFEPVATTPTNKTGDYTFTVRPDLTTDYRTVAKVSPEVVSDTVRARVRMRISRRVSDRTPKAGRVVVFSGFVGPAHDGRRVYIQRRKADGSWRTKARTRLVDAGDTKPLHSAYSRGLRINRDGVYRVLVRRDADHLGNTTRRVRLDTH